MHTVKFQIRTLLCAGLFFGLGAQAEIGNVQSDLDSLESSIPADLESEPTKGSTPVETSVQEVSQTEKPLPVYRPWNLDLPPAGPTAFVLDRGQFEFGVSTGGFEKQIGMYRLYNRVRYGVTDSLTVGVAPEIFFQSSLVELKWNFLNLGRTSYSITPWTGFHIRHRNQYFQQKDIPFALELSASTVIDERHRWHYGIGVGKNRKIYRSLQTYYDQYGVQSDYLSVTTEEAIRANAAYELRVSREHSLSFSLAPFYQKEVWEEAYSNGETSKGVLAGVGFQYYYRKFGAMVGGETGPVWRRYTYQYHDYYNESVLNSYNYSSMHFGLTLSASATARF